MATYLTSLLGGMLIGLSAVLLLLANGRIAGISGIFGSLLGGTRFSENGLFVAGLICGPLVYAALTGNLPEISAMASWPVLIIAGLLVGIGTRMGSGCTSGHGILGLARFSKRSAVATLCFLGAGIATATLTGLFA